MIDLIDKILNNLLTEVQIKHNKLMQSTNVLDKYKILDKIIFLNSLIQKILKFKNNWYLFVNDKFPKKQKLICLFELDNNLYNDFIHQLDYIFATFNDCNKMREEYFNLKKIFVI